MPPGPLPAPASQSQRKSQEKAPSLASMACTEPGPPRSFLGVGTTGGCSLTPLSLQRWILNQLSFFSFASGHLHSWWRLFPTSPQLPRHRHTCWPLCAAPPCVPSACLAQRSLHHRPSPGGPGHSASLPQAFLALDPQVHQGLTIRPISQGSEPGTQNLGQLCPLPSLTISPPHPHPLHLGLHLIT